MTRVPDDPPMYPDGGTSMSDVYGFLQRSRQGIVRPENIDKAMEHLRSTVDLVEQLSNLLIRIKNQASASLPADLAREIDRMLKRVQP
jgi:hypothetical protein